MVRPVGCEYGLRGRTRKPIGPTSLYFTCHIEGEGRRKEGTREGEPDR